jgi:cobalt/nickel transport system permease protein
MHIPDGFVSSPINLACAAVALAGLALALSITRRRLDERQVPLVGMTAAFVFAAQILNFPVAGGTSGHFLGAVFCALLLGPWAAGLAMSLVLIVQCLLFADGGITALGTNIVNMAVVGLGLGYGVTRLLLLVLPRSPRGGSIAVALGSWCSVMAAAAACSLELAASGKPLGVILPPMLGIHALIGTGEAFITVSALALVTSARPDLMPVLHRYRAPLEDAAS